MSSGASGPEMVAPAGVRPSRTPTVSRRGYGIAAAVFVVASTVAVVALALAFTTIRSGLEKFESVDAWTSPRTFELPPGQYFVFIEADDDLSGPLTPFTFHMFHGSELDPTEPQLQMDAPPERNTLEAGGHRYQLVGNVELRGGTYSAYVFGPRGTRARFGRIEVRTPLLLTLGGVGVGVLGFLAAGVVLIVTLVRRSTMRARERASAAVRRAPPPPAVPMPPPPTSSQLPPPPLR